jgi:hypothetical protein
MQSDPIDRLVAACLAGRISIADLFDFIESGANVSDH